MKDVDQKDIRKTKITDITCPNCGAPAKFDILKQQYHCGSCGRNRRVLLYGVPDSGRILRPLFVKVVVSKS